VESVTFAVAYAEAITRAARVIEVILFISHLQGLVDGASIGARRCGRVAATLRPYAGAAGRCAGAVASGRLNSRAGVGDR
jgi:hypothetical protein